MYTVARFVDDEEKALNVLEKLGRQMNGLIPGFFTGFDRAGGRFSGVLEEGEDWSDHLDAIAAFLDKCAGAISDARNAGFSIEIDSAIEHEDYEDSPVTSFLLTSDVMEKMSARDVTFVFSVY